ncbi:MAG: hypothetical protein ABI298_05405 [Acidimicrobiales bacterium]
MKRTYIRVTALLSIALLAAPLSIVASVAAPAGAATKGHSTHLLTCGMQTTKEPSNYLLSCGDANAGFVSMKWTSWTKTSATGHGILRQNDCKPNCVSGKWIHYTTSVSLGKVVTSKKYGALYSKATFHWNVNGVAKSEVFGLAD